METTFKQPNETELEEIYTNVVLDDSKCYDSNNWTDWNSVNDPLMNDGDEFETLNDHKIMFG